MKLKNGQEFFQWDVQKYGSLIDQTDLSGEWGCITTKVYKHDNRYFIETWQNGVNILFTEEIK